MAKESKALTTTQTTAALLNWNDPKVQLQIKEAYGKNLTEPEWNLFMGLGIATGLNPFLREIWAVKYVTNAASVFVGRDGYRRSAQSHKDYEYHYAMAVYANDQFALKNGEPEHTFKPSDRGALVGAYCVVKRKSSERPVTTWVDVKEYKQTYGVWATKPATMCVKVAEAQGLRASFQELFAGTYEESENWKEDKDHVVDLGTHELKPEGKDPMAPLPGQTTVEDQIAAKTEPEAPKPRRGRPAKAATAPESKVIDAEVVPPPTSPVAQEEAPADWQQKPGNTFNNIMSKPVATPAAPAPAPAAPKVPEDAIPPGKIRTDQTKKLFAVWGEYKKVANIAEAESAPQRKKLMKEMFGIDSSTQLNERQADELAERIEAMTEMARDYTGGEAGARAAGESF